MNPVKFVCAILAALLAFSPACMAETAELLNVSYDPTRELYDAINPLFAKQWRERNGQDIHIHQSHGGSGKQARSVIDGLAADVVTLALAFDIDEIATRTGKIPADWQTRFANHSCPYTSTIVFLVRKGNPKNVHDWDDLVRDGLQVITPNPKTSGGARWNYLAAWGYANEKFKGDDAQVRDYMTKLFRNVPILDTGARGSTITFVQRGIGDVLLAWENEALLAQKQLGKGELELVAPSVSILAEPPVAVVDGNAEKHGSGAAAKAYLEFLYTKEAQEVIGNTYFRPADADVAKRFADRFPAIRMLSIDNDFGGWQAAQKTHFNDGGTFDLIYQAR